MTDSSVTVNHGADGGDIVIRVAGRGTAAFGPSLRDFLRAAATVGMRSLTFDLGQCVYMDSTFIGILAMAAMDGREAKRPVAIANAGSAPRSHLASLGVEGLFTYVETAPVEGQWEPLEGTASGTEPGRLQALGKTALEAHEALGNANPENVPRFRDVIACLRQETRPGGHPGTGSP